MSSSCLPCATLFSMLSSIGLLDVVCLSGNQPQESSAKALQCHLTAESFSNADLPTINYLQLIHIANELNLHLVILSYTHRFHWKIGVYNNYTKKAAVRNHDHIFSMISLQLGKSTKTLHCLKKAPNMDTFHRPHSHPVSAFQPSPIALQYQHFMHHYLHPVPALPLASSTNNSSYAIRIQYQRRCLRPCRLTLCSDWWLPSKARTCIWLHSQPP